MRFAPVDMNGSLARYLEEVQRRSCPYIGPSQSRGHLHFNCFFSASESVLDEARFFAVALTAVERFRRERRTLPPVESQLLCHNLLLSPAVESEPATREDILAWSHWLLKLLFSRCNIMFGKFWVGQRFTDRNGNPIPEPPASFLSIRTGVVAKDPRFFFTYNDELRPKVASVEDRPEFDPIASLVDKNWSCLSDVELFERVRAWALAAHPPHNSESAH